MFLVYDHNINGKKYSGEVIVDEDLYGHLAHYEGKKVEAELSMFQSKTRQFQIMQSGRAVEMKK